LLIKPLSPLKTRGCSANCVRNAIEAMQTDKNDRRLLQVSSGRGGDKIIVAVEDSGPGINPKHTEGIFDTFLAASPFITLIPVYVPEFGFATHRRLVDLLCFSHASRFA
jgi:hypothetical protein